MNQNATRGAIAFLILVVGLFAVWRSWPRSRADATVAPPVFVAPQELVSVQKSEFDVDGSRPGWTTILGNALDKRLAASIQDAEGKDEIRDMIVRHMASLSAGDFESAQRTYLGEATNFSDDRWKGYRSRWNEGSEPFRSIKLRSTDIEIRWVDMDPKYLTGWKPQSGEAVSEYFRGEQSLLIEGLKLQEHKLLELRMPVRTTTIADGTPTTVLAGYRFARDAKTNRWVVRSAVTYSDASKLARGLPL